jgi:hypothetical protein
MKNLRGTIQRFARLSAGFLKQQQNTYIEISTIRE